MPIKSKWPLVILLSPILLPAQDLRPILERLDRLEEQNRELTEEIRALRKELAAAQSRQADTSERADERARERLDVQEQRIDEQAQTKVESSQKFPLRLTGMALFNSFLNAKQSGGLDYPTVASPTGPGEGGASFRQTLVGLEYSGPETFDGGKVRGSLYMDFFGNSGLRLRTASIEMDWKDRSVMAGLEKPIFSPREPASLAQVGISPLTGAGNLWLWIPQVRFEQDFRFGDTSGLRARLGVVQTREVPGYTAISYSPDLERSRPGLEGRFEFFHGAGRRLEIAPGFHYSASHAADTSIPSHVYSLDWFTNPLGPFEFTGEVFTGQNVAHLGTGGLRQGFIVLGDGNVRPVHSQGGWAQLTWLATQRLSFHLFSGQQDDRNADLLPGRIGKNLEFGANFFYHLAPNVILALESSQVRTTYVNAGRLLNNHYDLALAYLF